jgi:predicted nucleic acid-binding protein
MADFNCLDTNAVLRLQLKDIPEQHLRVSKIITKAGRRFIIPDVVFFEISFTLDRGYKFFRTDIKDFIESLMTIPNIVCNDNILRPALESFVEHPKLSFADCYLAEYARVKQAEPLWTFDRGLARRSGTVKLIPV